MISPNDIKVTKTDLTVFTTVLVVSNLINSQLTKSALFDEAWMNLSVATLLGVALHGLLTNKVSTMVNDNLKSSSAGVKQAIYDVVKFGTIFASQRAIVSYIEGKQIVFDREWMMNSGLIIAGYGAYSIFVADMMPKVSALHQPFLNDVVKVSMGALLANYVMDGTITKAHLTALAVTLAGFAVFDYGTVKLVTDSSSEAPAAPASPTAKPQDNDAPKVEVAKQPRAEVVNKGNKKQ